MDNETGNISALFKKPAPLNPALGLKKPGSSSPFASDPALAKKTYSHVNNKASSPARSQADNPVKKDFSLVDLSKGQVKDSSIYKSDFRNKTRNALKGTLGSYKDRNTVANILWDRRGNGLNSGEIKKELRKAEQKGTLRPDQVKAVRRKMGIY